jgi:serine protease Do
MFLAKTAGEVGVVQFGDSNMNNPEPGRRQRPKLRAALLGAAAVVALGGVAVEHAIAPNVAFAQNVSNGNLSGPQSFADIVARVKPAVVSVRVKMVEKEASADEDDQSGGGDQLPFPPDDPLRRFFRRFEGPNGPLGGQQQHPQVGEALGSGFIISADGYVVTNNHVVENATDVTVTTDDGKTHPARIVGTDKKTDLALLKLSDGGTYPYVQWSNDTPRVGDWVIAVGNPFGLGGTVTAGIVSARGRDIGAGPYDDFLQIDAPVNRGNSGGPSFNMEGQVVGINTAIYSPSGGSVGIGFDIPADIARTVIEDLRTKGVVERGWIGVQIQPVTSDIADSLGLKSTHGALVADTQANSPAAKAGIHSGDVITTVDGDDVEGPRELARTIAGFGPDKHVKIGYIDNGQQKTVDVVLGTLPADQTASNDTPAPQDNGSSTLQNFGMTLSPASTVPGAGSAGVVVTDIDPNGVAAQKGLQQGDIILDAGGKPVVHPSDITAAISAAKKDGRTAVLLRVKNGDSTRFVALATSAKAG